MALIVRPATFFAPPARTQVCSSARSVIHRGQHIQHTGVFDNTAAPSQSEKNRENFVPLGETGPLAQFSLSLGGVRAFGVARERLLSAG
jgi:hypothetical protein